MLFPGTMATKEGRLSLRISMETLKALDELRRVEVDLPSRSEMVIRLVERAKAAQAKAKKES